MGISLGVISAVKQYSVLDTVATVTAMVFASVPAFWFGMMATLIFSLKLHLLPSNGIDSWTSYILPIVTLVVSGSAGLLRMTRSAMLETVQQDYIRTAVQRGQVTDVVIKQALKNALLPVITSLGMSFGTSLGGAVDY